MGSAVPRYLTAASSDQGLVRPNNEDRVYCDENRGFFLVVDGMGGHEGGEEAAEIAIQRIRARLERQTDSAEQRLREAITLANNAIYEAAEDRPASKGMACVLTAAVIENGQVTVGHVGDSRLYRITRGTIEKLTHDHSPVGEREDSGELTELEAMQHPRRNEVYRDVGSEQHAPDDEGFVEILNFPFAEDSALLLCSDGLTDAVTSAQILNIVKDHVGDRRATVENLIAAATEIGHDNVSVIWVEGARFVESYSKRVRSRKKVATSVSTPNEQIARVPTLTEAARWYRSAPAYLVLGALLGAALAVAIGVFWLRARAPHAAQIVVVPAEASIVDALRTAQAGDTLVVAPGNYPEVVTLKEDVSVTAQQAGEAVIEGGIIADHLHSARLEGFEVRGGEFGIRIRSSDVILARDEITGSQTAGVEFSGASRGAIFGCRIYNNAGAGVKITDNASPVIENNVIVDNGKQPAHLSPGVFVHSSAAPVIVANTFSGNGAESIWLPAADESVLQRNFFLSSRLADSLPKLRLVPLQGGAR